MADAGKPGAPPDPHQVATAATVFAGPPARAPQARRRARRAYGPFPAVLAGAGLAATLALVCVAVTLRGRATVSALEQRPRQPTQGAPPGSAATAEAPDPPASRAKPAELDQARTQGVAALTALAERFPEDTAVLKALAMAHARDRSGLMPAVVAVKRLIEFDAAEAASADLRQILLRAANGPPDIAAIAFELMSAKMGSHGPDLLYDILIAQMGKHPQERAEKLLADPEVRKRATLALLVADDLRRTKKCPDKPILDRAREHGDARAVHYLKAQTTPMKCGFLGMKRCMPCPKVQADIRAAIDAIEKRRATP